MTKDIKNKKLIDLIRLSLHLPKTTFPMRANAIHKEKEIQKRKYINELYDWQLKYKKNAPLFILHDGPPFANGDLHIGHFLNKILKDIINRYKLLRGYRISFIPGWDCHGLPIEHKALNNNNNNNNNNKLTPLEIRYKCRKLALKAITSQKKDMLRWGILSNINHINKSNIVENNNNKKIKEYYTTMDKEYEVKQYEILLKMIKDNIIFRQLKPVYWSTTSQTALAESELEYNNNHISKQAYILFELINNNNNNEINLNKLNNRIINAVIWTTTPWTLPANMALAVHPNISYSFITISISNIETKLNQNKEYHSIQDINIQNNCYLVATDLIDNFLQKTLKTQDNNITYKIIHTLKGNELKGLEFHHPFLINQISPIILGDHVTSDNGTGIVHTAPGHGLDDYNCYMKYIYSTLNNKKSNNVKIKCPVDEKGNFSSDIGLAELIGLNVIDNNQANKMILNLLKDHKKLFPCPNGEYIHRYPYDWRTKQPVIFRATTQWFASLNTLHDLAFDTLKEDQINSNLLQMIPKQSKKRFVSTLKTRNEWCISRQRSWGLPIPVFYYKNQLNSSNNYLFNEDTLNYFIKLVSIHGSDCWYKLSIQELLPTKLLHLEHINNGENLTKSMDTLDVWFDSGSSFYSVLQNSHYNPEINKNCTNEILNEDSSTKEMLTNHSLTNDFKSENKLIKQFEQSDVVLEGSDQHRGWFQSSLLLSLIKQKKLPYKNIITHGFVLDENATKMSKSIGNTLKPDYFIQSNIHSNGLTSKGLGLGVDILRYWAGTSDFTSDMKIGDEIIKKKTESFLKIRNISRFLLANINDLNTPLRWNEINNNIDKYMLIKLCKLNKSITLKNDLFLFSQSQLLLSTFLSNDVSSFYTEITKDILYCGETNIENNYQDNNNKRSRREQIQTVYYYILDSIIKIIAPVACHTAEEIYEHFINKNNKNEHETSLFMQKNGWLHMKSDWETPTDNKDNNNNKKIENDIDYIRSIKTQYTKNLEMIRNNDTNNNITVSAETNVILTIKNEEKYIILKNYETLLPEILLCAAVHVIKGNKDNIQIERTNGLKCIRCWKYCENITHNNNNNINFCPRCVHVIKSKNITELINAYL